MKVARRRMAAALAAVVVVLAGLAAAIWWIWVPNHRPELKPRERYGIDVSAHQGRIDWTEVAGDGIDFVYVKATEGGDFTDPRFAGNWRGVAASGLGRGAYHFFTLCASGAVQARHFMATVPDGRQLPPALDLEIAGNCSARPTSDVVAREVDAFITAVEAERGQRLILYIGREWEDRYPTAGRWARRRWVPSFLHRPSEPDWVIWQVSFRARVRGVEGDVDLDVGRP